MGMKRDEVYEGCKKEMKGRYIDPDYQISDYKILDRGMEKKRI